MRTILATVLLALTLAAPALQAQAGDVVVDAGVAAVAVADLANNAQDQVRFRLAESDFPNNGTLQSAFVRLTHAGEPDTDLALTGGSGVWVTSLAVATPDLVVGDWSVQFHGVGPQAHGTLATRTLRITSSDHSAPLLLLAKPASPVLVGPGDSVALFAQDGLLRRVTFQFNGLPEALPLAFPYALKDTLLPEGLTKVTFQASDRAGHTTTLVADVLRDSVPPVLNVTLPEHAYNGVPFTVTATVMEQGPYTLRITANGTPLPDQPVVGSVAAGVNRTTTFTLQPLVNGSLSLVVEAIDRVGSRALDARTVHLEKPVTDLRLTRLATEGSGPLFAQRPVRLNATVEQIGGVATLQVPVNVTANGQSRAFIVTVPPQGPKGVTWEVQLPAGRYTAMAALVPPANANETNPGNENASLDVEVFLGRVVDNGTSYDIRAGSTGLPSVAVLEGQSTTYPLTLVDNGRGVAYRFTLPGNHTVDWDPLDPLGESAAASGATNDSASQSSSTGSKASPAAGPLAALLVVALAALAQRRR